MKYSYSSTLFGSQESLPVFRSLSSFSSPSPSSPSQLVNVSLSSPFAILRGVKTQPTETIYSNAQLNITEILQRFAHSKILTIDLETDGLDIMTCQIYTVGLSDGNTTAYIATDPNKQEQINEVLLFLSRFPNQLAGFNLAFDAGVLRVHLEARGQTDLTWKWDVYTLFKSLANEGWLGQTWGLKQAQIDLLGWESKGSDGVDRWLVDAGHYTSTSRKVKNSWVRKEEVDGTSKWYSPEKSKMYLCPSDILGHYCALDAYSTHLLLTQVLFPSMDGHDWVAVELGFHDLLIENMEEVIENRLKGFTVDLDMLNTYINGLDIKVSNMIELIHLIEPIKRFNTSLNYNKLKKMEGKEPRRITTGGMQSKTWEKWIAKKERLEGEKFNLKSGKKLIDFFYTFLNAPVTQLTKKKRPSVGVKAMKEFVIRGGEIGAVAKELLSCRKVEKELGYVNSCLISAGEGVELRYHLKNLKKPKKKKIKK